jgi:GT2 family glycosyltransferase
MSKLSIVLVNYRGWRDTLACVASLRMLRYAPVEIIVIENGSPDDSWERLRDVDDIQLVRLERNVGFAGACNHGMRIARDAGAEFVWLLNNDTVVEPDAASALVRLARDKPEAHFFGTLISFHDEPELLWFGGGDLDRLTGTPGHVGFMQPVGRFSSGVPKPTTWISGCSLLIRTTSLETVGFMDDDLFLYAEDMEWQLRARQEYPVAWMSNECLVRHKVGRSTGSTNNVLGRVFMSRNFLKVALRHAGSCLPMWLGRWVIEFVVKPAAKGDLRLARAGWAGLLTQRTDGAEIVARYSGNVRR